MRIRKAALTFVGLFVTFLVVGCGAPTGPFIPDTRPQAPPLCTSDNFSLPISVGRDPLAAIPSAKDIDRVTWSVHRICATSIPPDSAGGRGGRATANCFITQYVHGDTVVGGTCVDGSPAWFALGAASQPDRVGFNLNGAVIGNVCVRGTVFFTDDTMLDLPMRAFRVASGIPDISFGYGDSSDIPPVAILTSILPPSMVGCPDT